MSNIVNNLVIVEGNIAAGKTTLCEQLAKSMGARVWCEPVEDNPYLERFYADPKKYALPLQIWILKRRFVNYLEALKFIASDTSNNRSSNSSNSNDSEGTVVLLDRSIFSDYVFAMKNFRDGNITSEGFAQYIALYKWMLRNLPVPAVTLYLDVDPGVCHDRILNVRRRECEKSIELDYLEGLDACYKTFTQSMARDTGSTVLNIPWNAYGDSGVVANLLRSTLDVQHWKIRLLSPPNLQQQQQQQQQQHWDRITAKAATADGSNMSNDSTPNLLYNITSFLDKKATMDEFMDADVQSTLSMVTAGPHPSHIHSS